MTQIRAQHDRPAIAQLEDEIDQKNAKLAKEEKTKRKKATKEHA